MRLILVSLCAWLAGLASYVAALEMLWGETLEGADLSAVRFWSALASALAIAVVYAPAMFAVRQQAKTSPTPWPYALTGVAIGLVPVLLILLAFGGNGRSLLSAEAGLFFVLFSAFGFVFGVGFWLAYARAA